MASIQSLGIGSGLLTNELVDDIIEAERESGDRRLERREAKVDAQITAYGEVQSAIGKLQSSARSLADVNAIRETTASSTNESAVSATTNNQAETGNYSLRVDNVAEAHTVASQRYNAVTDTVGTGTLTFNFGGYDFNEDGDITGFEQNDEGKTFELDITSGNNTLTGIRDAINAQDMGVQASLVNDGQGYRLLFSSEETGEMNAMEITADGDSGLQGLAFNAAQNDPDSNMSMTQKAMDANLSVNGLEITSASNELTEVARGVTFNLNDATNGSTVNVSVTRDPSGMVERVESFLEAYNEFKDLYDELTDFDSDTEQGGLLIGDSALRQVENQVRRSLTQLVEGMENSQFRTLADIGIFTDRNDDFKLALDSQKLTNAFQTSIDDVTGLFATKTQADDALINYITKSEDTKPGDYDIEVTQLATQGELNGRSISGFEDDGQVVISGSNDNFRINVDGTAADVELTQGTYDSPEDLALMIQNSINNTSGLQDRGRSVTVEFDSAKQSFNITSSQYGSQSQVFMEDLDPMVANTLGFTVPGQGDIQGASFTGLGSLAFGATTAPGSREVFSDDGFDLEANPTSFDLTLGGTDGADGTYSITLDEDLSDVMDTQGNVVEARDRDDMLSYINSELNAAGLSGVVSASFNSGNRLVFSTAADDGTQSIELSNVDIDGTDFFGLEDAMGVRESGVSIDGAEFEIAFTNRYGTVESEMIAVPDGIYETPEALSAAIQDAIDADPNIAASASGAITLPGSRPIGDTINFENRASGFQFDYNGVTMDVNVDTNGDDNLDSIQQALDAALVDAGFDAGDVLAIEQAGGLALETAAAGSDQSLSVLSDGQGDRTDPGNELAGGFDFSADPASFTLRMDNTDIEVSLDADMSGASEEDTLAYIQQRLDQGLLAADGGGAFTTGDIKAQLDDNGELFFESQSKNGSKTSATFGALASLEVVDANQAATDTIGIAEQSANFSGLDAFGLDKGTFTGFSAESTVSYDEDDRGRGSFNVSFDNDTRMAFTSVSNAASAQLGFSLADGTENEVETGKDVEGKINGTTAIGRGQVLTAGSGTEAATNGYILGSPGFDFSSAIELTPQNNSLEVTVDGVASGPITLEEGVYATGGSLAAAMTEAINSNESIQSGGKQVEVQYDQATDTFGIFSASTGSESTVRLTQIDPELSAITGLSTTSEVVDGEDSTGEEDPAQGIALRVLGGETGERGSVSFVQGVFDQLSDLFRDMLSSRGTITSRMDRLDQQMEDIAEERSNLDRRMDAQRARLQAQFSFNDRIISQLNSTEDFLTQQFEIMNGMMANRNK